MDADYHTSAHPALAAGWSLTLNQGLPLSRGYETALGFRVENIGFLVDTGIYCEIIERPIVSPLPNVEPWFSGLLNIRGNIIPVIDISLLLGAPPKRDKKRFLFAVDRGEKTMAFWIDGHPKLLTAVTQPLNTPPVLPDLLQRYVTDSYYHDNETWLTVQFADLFQTLGQRHNRAITQGGIA
jgi:twitching motility protein PilI